jgi:hypothetical protein
VTEILQGSLLDDPCISACNNDQDNVFRLQINRNFSSYDKSNEFEQKTIRLIQYLNENKDLIAELCRRYRVNLVCEVNLIGNDRPPIYYDKKSLLWLIEFNSGIIIVLEVT